VLKAWAESLCGITFPLLSDFWPHGEIAQRYGVLRDEGYTERALFIIDREGVIQYIDIHDIDDQPDNEVLFAELRRIDPEAAAIEPPQPPAEELPTGGIVMYGVPIVMVRGIGSRTGIWNTSKLTFTRFPARSNKCGNGEMAS
jgi:hypothetical protein